MTRPLGRFLDAIHGGHVLGIALALAVPLSVFMAKAMAPLSIIACVLGLAAYWRREGHPPPIPWPLAGLFAGVSAWGATSLLWSVAPGETAGLILPLTAGFVCGILLIAQALALREEERRFFETALVVGVVVGVALLAVEVFSFLTLTRFLRALVKGRDLLDQNPDNTFFYQPGASVAALLGWPAALILWRRGWRLACVALAVGFVGVAARGGANAAVLGVAAGMVAFGVALLAGRYGARALVVLLVAGVAAAPVLPRLVPEVNELWRVAPNLPDSVYPRIFIWQSAARFIAESPLLGKGLDSSRSLSNASEKVSILGEGVHYRKIEPIPLHPHNAALQVWLELGLVGAGFLMALVLLVHRAVERSVALPWRRAMTYGGLYSCAVMAFVSQGIWQAWWQGILWLMATSMVVALHHRRDAPTE